MSDDELLVAAESALASLAVAHGRLWRRHRRAFFERTGRPPSVSEVVTSDGRAAMFAVQRQLLRHSDDHPALARLLRDADRRQVLIRDLIARRSSMAA